MKEIIKKLSISENLTKKEAMYAMDQVLDNGATLSQISAFLTLLRAKGESVEEIIGCAEVMKQKALHIFPEKKNHIDLVGTGGDGSNTFNISTTAAFVVVGIGVPVAKHGNRAISSCSGSTDVLESLGIHIRLTPEQVTQCVDEIGIGFMFAKEFNPCMKNVSIVRSELGIRTIFNILGPISNPSDAHYQVVGVYKEELVHPLAVAMSKMGIDRGVVMCSGGIDEFTTVGLTTMSEIKDGIVSDYIFNPQEYGFPICDKADILGGTKENNAHITRSILSGEKGAKRDTVLLNAGVSIYIQGAAGSIAEGIKFAEESIDKGLAFEKLNKLIDLTQKMKGA